MSRSGGSAAAAAAAAQQQSSVSNNSSSNSSNESINMFQIMEDLNDKLKLLNYERTVLSAHPELKPLNRHYFCLATKPSEQFPYFQHLVSFLFKCLNLDISEWNEFDDPNTISSNIVDQLTALRFTIDFPVSKLRHGSGESVILVLDFLADKVLQKQGFNVLSPIYTSNNTDTAGDTAAEAVDDGEDSTAEEDAINDSVITDDIDEGGASGINDSISNSLSGSAAGSIGNNNNRFDSTPIIQHAQASRIDPIEWRLELERVGPKLKSKSTAALSLNNSTKEWRIHIDQARNHSELMHTVFETTVKSALDKLSNQLKLLTEKINTKERSINKEFELLGSEMRTKQLNHSELQSIYQSTNNTIQALNNELMIKSDQVELIKSQMMEKNNAATDTAPLRKLTNSYNTVKSEIHEMELRIGLLSQTLLIAKVKHQQELNKKTKSNKSSSNSNNPNAIKAK